MREILAGAVGMASGMAVSAAVFALIAAIGVVPTMAKKTDTARFVVLYEEAIIWGGIFGTASMIFNFKLNALPMVTAVLSLSIGVFFGVFAMSLAESLDVLPILSKRLDVKQGIPFFVAALAFGKMAGSLLYFLVSGFHKPGG